MSEKHYKWMAIAAAILALISLGIAWYLGHRSGVVAGAAAAAAAGSKFWAARGRDEEVIEDASDTATEAIEKLHVVRDEAGVIVEDNREEIASMAGEDKAKLVDKLTDF